jgi:hypothetical protein
MALKNYTKYFIFLSVGIILGYDVVAICLGGEESSISQAIIKYSYAYPFMTFLSGFVCGHFFWRLKSNKDLSDSIGENK